MRNPAVLADRCNEQFGHILCLLLECVPWLVSCMMYSTNVCRQAIVLSHRTVLFCAVLLVSRLDLPLHQTQALTTLTLGQQ